MAGPLPTHGQDPSALVHVHPIAALALGDPNLPDDLALEPRDCLSLWQVMRQTGEHLDPSLTPSAFFAFTPSSECCFCSDGGSLMHESWGSRHQRCD